MFHYCFFQLSFYWPCFRSYEYSSLCWACFGNKWRFLQVKCSFSHSINTVNHWQEILHQIDDLHRINTRSNADYSKISGQFALCYRTLILSVRSVTLVYCGQTVGWIKMKPGMQVGLGPGHIVRWGPISPPLKGHSPPIFGPYLLWPNGCMD